MVESNKFSVSNIFQGVLPSMPNATTLSPTFDLSLLQSKIDNIKDATIDTWTDS